MIALSLGLGVLAASGSVPVGAQQSPCPRKPERSFAVGSVTVIEDERPPCRVEFRETGIRLEAVADGSRPDPGRTVLVDSNGRYYSANASGWGAVISVWDSRGRYMTSFGREGEGPGELRALGMKGLVIDSRDNLHVRDDSRDWSVFSPEQEFLRRARAHAMGALWGEQVMVLDDGSALSSNATPPDPQNFFVLFDSSGARQRSFGPVGETSPGSWGRPIAHAGGDTFWAAPPEVGSNAYVLEEWGIDGELRRTLRRDVAWFEWRGEREISPAVVQMNIARDGLLYVLVRRPTPDYLRSFSRDGGRQPIDVEARRRRDGGTEVVVEVIDTRSGELLASDIHAAAELRERVPRRLFRGMMRGFRYGETEAGFPYVDIVAVVLVPK